MNEQERKEFEDSLDATFNLFFGDDDDMNGDDFNSFRHSEFDAEHTTQQVVIPSPFDDMGQDMVVTVDSKTQEISVETSKPVSFKKGQLVRVVPHTVFMSRKVDNSEYAMRHDGYASAQILSIDADGSVEVEVNQFGDIDVVDIKHLEALS